MLGWERRRSNRFVRRRMLSSRILKGCGEGGLGVVEGEGEGKSSGRMRGTVKEYMGEWKGGGRELNRRLQWI